MKALIMFLIYGKESKADETRTGIHETEAGQKGIYP